MQKGNTTPLLVAAILAGLAYLAFHPTAAQDLSNWVQRQVGGTGKRIGHPNYTPVLPAR
jgi:hypothetical protein